MEFESVLTVPDLVEPIFDNSDLPIAVRKGVRSCTKHPISNFISYEKLSPTFRAFSCELTKIEIPRDIQEALRVPKWKEAVLEEMRALEKKSYLESGGPTKRKNNCGMQMGVYYQV